jgi:hypothetical protein
MSVPYYLDPHKTVLLQSEALVNDVRRSTLLHSKVESRLINQHHKVGEIGEAARISENAMDGVVRETFDGCKHA